MWYIKYDTNDPIDNQKQTHRHREEICGYQGGKRSRRRLEQEIGFSNLSNLVQRSKLLCIEWINIQVLLYSTGNYIQYPMVYRNGEEYDRQCVCVYKTESFCCTAEINTTL